MGDPPTVAGGSRRCGTRETFVKTLKRDGMRVSPIPTPDQIPGWFDHYNKTVLTAGCRIRSPREFRRAHQPAEASSKIGVNRAGFPGGPDV
jgi:hypothetical protein